MNTVSGRIVVTTLAGRVIVAAPRRHGDEVAVGDADLLGEPRVHLAQRLGVLVDERGDAPGLGAGQVLADDPAGGQPDRVLVVDHLGRLLERHAVEAGPAVGMEERAALVEAGRARVADLGDRPEQAHLVLDPLPRGARSSRRCRPSRRGAAPRRSARCRRTGSTRPWPSRSARSTRISQSRRASPGGVDGGVDLDDPALTAGRRALVLLVQRAGQHDVGVVGGLGQEEVDDGVELEPVERLGGEVGVGRRDGRVEADRQQPLDLPGVDRLDDLLRRDALARDLRLVAAPHRRRCAARCSGLVMSRLPGSWSHLWPCSRPPWPLPCPVIVDTPQPGLPNLPVARPRLMAASTLSTPLVCCSMPRAWSSIPVAAVPHHSAACSMRAAGTPVISAAQPGVMSATAAAASSKPTVWASMNSWSSQVAADQLVQHRAEQRRVGARPDAEEEVGRAGQRHDPRVLHDQLGAAVAGPPDVARGDRERLGDVRAGDPHHVGERDVAPRVGAAVDAERLLVAGAGRHHAVAAVVVEVGGVQGEAGELADQVALLVGQRDARQHGERVVAVGLLDAADLADDPVERLVPRDPPEPAGRGGVALERVQQPVGVAALEVPLDALRAELALVERELVPRLEADDLVVTDLELDPALLPAEAAVGVDDAVDLERRRPTRRAAPR